MLTLTKLRGKLDHANLRTEKHGESNVVATDLKITVDFPNTILDSIEPGLLEALYRRPTKNDDPDLFDNSSDAIPLRKVRFPRLEQPLGFDSKFVGCQLVIARGISDLSALRFADVTVDKLRIETKEGGTVTLTMRAIVHTDGELDALAEMIQSEIEFSVMPPATTQTELAEAA